MSMTSSDSSASDAPLAVNAIARSYQPRRVSAAAISIIWNLGLAAFFIFSGAGEGLLHVMRGSVVWTTPLYVTSLFVLYALANFPLELRIGYLEERQFGLAKDGIRAWARDWLAANAQHGVMFVIGGTLIVTAQRLAPVLWLPVVCVIVLVLFLVTTWQAPALLPQSLFDLQAADEQMVERLRMGTGVISELPPVVIFSHPNLREFSGGLLGMGKRQVLLISRSTLDSASDAVLRFVVLHEMGHRRYHHILLSALAGWAWVAMGLSLSHLLIPPAAFGSPLYIGYLALAISVWMGIGEPFLAYLGRRLEYQADRFYLNHGGTVEEMKQALDELAQRNLARTEALRRRETLFHPLPSITNRLHAAAKHQGRSQ